MCRPGPAVGKIIPHLPARPVGKITSHLPVLPGPLEKITSYLPGRVRISGQAGARADLYDEVQSASILMQSSFYQIFDFARKLPDYQRGEF